MKAKGLDEIFCSSCGEVIKKEAEICPYCGVKNKLYSNINIDINNISLLNRTVTFLLCFFVGWIGIHRFYVGKVGTGILYMLTFGLFGIGTIVDLVLIITGNFKDKDDKNLINW